MTDVLVALFVALVAATLAGAVLVGGGLALVGHRLRKRNAVSRRYPTSAPLHWQATPGTWAALHRRLRDAVAVLRHAVPDTKGRHRQAALDASPLARLADELEQHAAALDHDLVVAAHTRGPARTSLRQHLITQVLQLEALCQRVAAAASASVPPRPGSEPTPEALGRIGEELDALEAARDEIARLEAHLGVSWSRSELPPR
jgi:hypothetical protein